MFPSLDGQECCFEEVQRTADGDVSCIESVTVQVNFNFIVTFLKEILCMSLLSF